MGRSFHQKSLRATALPLWPNGRLPLRDPFHRPQLSKLMLLTSIGLALTASNRNAQWPIRPRAGAVIANKHRKIEELGVMHSVLEGLSASRLI